MLSTPLDVAVRGCQRSASRRFFCRCDFALTGRSTDAFESFPKRRKAGGDGVGRSGSGSRVPLRAQDLMSCRVETLLRDDPSHTGARPTRNWRKMLDIKRTNSLAALIGAVPLMTGAPALTQVPAAAPTAAASDAAPASDTGTATKGAVKNGGALAAPTEIKHAAGPIEMFLAAETVVKVVMIGLLLCSIFTWTLLVTKLLEFRSLNKTSDSFLEAFRGARSVSAIARTATTAEFEDNPTA